MSPKGRRYPLRTKEAKEILSQASDKLKMNVEAILTPRRTMEVVESELIRIFLVDGKPLLLKTEKVLLPTLLFSEVLGQLPKIVVDMGAVPFVCKGADVMAPGVVRIEGKFGKGDLVVVVDVKHKKPLGLGETLLASEAARALKHGPIVRNLHYVSDRFWQLIKAFTGN